ncbi:hypothetical protein MHYP_G00307350 [Metynnis hypsauchen]
MTSMEAGEPATMSMEASEPATTSSATAGGPAATSVATGGRFGGVATSGRSGGTVTGGGFGGVGVPHVGSQTAAHWLSSRLMHQSGEARQLCILLLSTTGILAAHCVKSIITGFNGSSSSTPLHTPLLSAPVHCTSVLARMLLVCTASVVCFGSSASHCDQLHLSHLQAQHFFRVCTHPIWVRAGT